MSRRRGHPVWAWAAVGVPAVCLGAVALVLVLGPKAGREGRDWNHRELLDHLNARGLGLHMTTAGGLVVFTAGDATAWAAENLSGGMSRRDAELLCTGPNLVTVEKLGTPQDAHDAAGRLDPRRSFAWGRFLFESDDERLLSRIRSALD